LQGFQLLACLTELIDEIGYFFLEGFDFRFQLVDTGGFFTSSFALRPTPSFSISPSFTASR